MGWKGESRRHSLSRKGIKTNLPDGRRFDVSNYVARGQLRLKEFPPKFMVGDSKLPNYYWVSTSNHFYVYHPIDLEMVGIDEIDKDLLDKEDRDFQLKGGTVAVFSTYREARDFAEMQSDDNVTIEDRLSGVLYENRKLKMQEWKEHFETHEDTQFTRDTMRKKGVDFE
ncbi:hypothetical protein KAU43_07750 [candidate division WOR-3 bacterium]|nr:hypothetical protein [candidate division WOR-3 bacterium]